MRNCYIFLISISVLAVINIGCSSDQSGPALFTRLSPESTGVTFTNQITTSDTLNNLNYPFTYHGGGVAIGDINNDGLPDLYFTANMQTSRLYLNKGEMKFEDITESAGVETNRWASGAAMADINGDGYLDIYVSTVSSSDAPEEARTNLLFINNGDNTFTEAAAQYNLNSTSYTTHSAFLDYDRDGDLDLYLLNHHPGLFARNNAVRPVSSSPYQESTSYDELYRNEGNGTFTKVGEEAGIVQQNGFGLGVAVSDINRDGWPDIYVSNDVVTNDVLYINNKDGTFSDKTAESLKHSSFAGMGVDIADFNNDGWPDIYQTEMMPNSLRMKKIMSGGISYEHYKEMRAKGYLHQYPLNTLQLSNGIDKNGDIIFSEIARMAQVAYTNWSWSTLFGDYDNDGLKDIMVTNGFPKAINNYDFLTEINQLGRFGTSESRQQKREKIMENLHGYEVPNYIFRNQGDLTFEDKSQDWNFDDAGYSYGASQADLDNDGDLDIVINNLNSPASIYQNQADTLTDNHYLSVKLLGSPMNTNGIGTKVVVKTGNDTQHQYFSPYRGYQSSLDKRMLFGLGNHETIDSLKVIWPDLRQQILTNLEANRQIELNYNEAKSSMPAEASDKENQIFTDITEELDIEYSHQENEYNDYDRQGLLPYQLSKLGPPLAVADVNGDGREDFFAGSAAGQAGSLYIQTEDGSFQKSEKQQPWTADRDYEDVGAVFFDTDGDGDLDLYVASGGYEFSPASEMLQDRLYLNNGSGLFARNQSALPQMLTSSSCVRPGDYDGDGDPDLFVGGRVVPRQYPFPAKSYILRNDNGSFTDVTQEIAPELVEPGLITDAQWSDFNNDDQLDLVTVGEWMPVQFFRNQENSFENVTGQLGMQNKTGWWHSLEKGDFDNDGDTDFVAGNLGQNYNYVASEEKPFHIFAHDFDSNQSVDLILAFEKDATLYPYYGKAKLGMKISAINELYQSYETFANASVEKVIGSGGIEEALNLKASTFASIYIENKGDEGFSATPLPNEAQISSINDIVSLNVDDDGNTDLLIASNLYNVEPQTARNDAGNGLLLKGNGEGDFEPVSPFKSGFLAPLMITDLEIIETDRGRIVVVVNNDNEIQVFKIN